MIHKKRSIMNSKQSRQNRLKAVLRKKRRAPIQNNQPREHRLRQRSRKKELILSQLTIKGMRRASSQLTRQKKNLAQVKSPTRLTNQPVLPNLQKVNPQQITLKRGIANLRGRIIQVHRQRVLIVVDNGENNHTSQEFRLRRKSIGLSMIVRPRRLHLKIQTEMNLMR